MGVGVGVGGSVRVCVCVGGGGGGGQKLGIIKPMILIIKKNQQKNVINRYMSCKENLHLWGKESSDKFCICNVIVTIEHFSHSVHTAGS